MRKEITSHQDLRVWRKGTRLAAECLASISTFPEPARHLGNRIRGKADSIPAEIERGFRVRQLAPYLYHLDRALTRVEALEPLLIEACSRGWIDSAVGDQLLRRTAEIQRMLRKLKLSLEAASQTRRRRALAK